MKASLFQGFNNAASTSYVISLMNRPPVFISLRVEGQMNSKGFRAETGLAWPPNSQTVAPLREHKGDLKDNDR